MAEHIAHNPSHTRARPLLLCTLLPYPPSLPPSLSCVTLNPLCLREHSYLALEDAPKPEILRVSLAQVRRECVCLHLVIIYYACDNSLNAVLTSIRAQ